MLNITSPSTKKRQFHGVTASSQKLARKGWIEKMLVFGYGEDALTLRALKTELSTISARELKKEGRNEEAHHALTHALTYTLPRRFLHG